jgi:phage shock protein C
MSFEHETAHRPGPYRSRRGIIFGVCRGIAEYYGFSIFWTRMLAVAGLIFTGIWPVVVFYAVAALLMKVEPVIPLESREEQEFYNSYTSSRSMALHRLKRTFDSLDRRIQRMESIVTAKEYDWEHRLKNS